MQKSSHREVIDPSGGFYGRKASTSCSSELQVKKKIMYPSGDLQRGVIARTGGFYQRDDSSIGSLVPFETLDAPNVVTDEWKTLMLSSATVLQSTDETAAAGAYPRT